MLSSLALLKKTHLNSWRSVYYCLCRPFFDIWNISNSGELYIKAKSGLGGITMKWTVLFHRVTIILLDFFKPHFLQEPCYQLDSHPLSVCMNVCMLHKITHSRSEIILYSRCFGYTKILAQHHSISPWVACGKIKGDVTQYIRSLIEWKTAS